MKEYVTSSALAGWNNLGQAIGGLKSTDLRWASPLELKNAVEAAFLEKFGAKEAAKPKGKVSPHLLLSNRRPFQPFESRSRRRQLPRSLLHRMSKPPRLRPVQSSKKASSDTCTRSVATRKSTLTLGNNILRRRKVSSTPDSPQNPTGTCTSGTRRLSS